MTTCPRQPFQACEAGALASLNLMKNTSRTLLIGLSLFIAACAPSSPMKVEIDILQKPIVDKVVDLIIEIRSSSDAPNTWVEITIPEDINIIQGVTDFRVSIQENKKFVYTMKIQIKQEGEYLISAYAFNRYSTEADHGGFGDGQTIYIVSDQQTAEILSWEEVRAQTPIGPCVNCSTLTVVPTHFGD